MTAAVVLAAGLSRRMGQAKLLLPVGGRPLVRHAVEGVRAAGLDPVLVVTGPDPAAISVIHDIVLRGYFRLIAGSSVVVTSTFPIASRLIMRMRLPNGLGSSHSSRHVVPGKHGL